MKQQLDGSIAAIMNPFEGEQEPGGQPFRGVQKAISSVPLFVCVSVCASDIYIYSPVQLNCVWHRELLSEKLECAAVNRVQTFIRKSPQNLHLE